MKTVAAYVQQLARALTRACLRPSLIRCACNVTVVRYLLKGFYTFPIPVYVSDLNSDKMLRFKTNKTHVENDMSRQKK